MKPHLPALLAVVLFSACDYVDEPLGADDGPPPPPPTDFPRRVLLEKFTGHTCTFCPQGELIAIDLQNEYGSDKLILMSIHEGEFAALSPPDYVTDFTTPDGDAYGAVFQPSAYPQGMIDRVRVNSSYTFSRNAWDERVPEVINLPARMEVELSSLELSGGQINAQVRIIVAEDLGTDAYSLTLALAENSIVAYQLNGDATPPDVPDYQHDHVFRGTLNGTWGQELVTAGALPGDTLIVDLPGLSIPANVLVPANCEVVAYVHLAVTYEILQVNNRKLVP